MVLQNNQLSFFVTELVCAVGVWNRDRDPDLDREIITGTATLTLS